MAADDTSLWIAPPLPWYRRLTGDLFGYVLLAPAVTLLAALTIYPLLYSIYVSFFRYTGGVMKGFIGLGTSSMIGDGQYGTRSGGRVHTVSVSFEFAFAWGPFLSQNSCCAACGAHGHHS
jgi:ABC-type sugar transport system permease subunit